MDRRIIKTKEAIQNAYTELLLEKDVTKITVSELARRANIDRKTFYLHYETTDDILHEIVVDKLQRFSAHLEAHNTFSDPLDANMFFKCATEYLKQDSETIYQLSGYSNMKFFWEEVQEILTKEMTGAFLSNTDFSQEEAVIYAKFLSAGIISIYTSWFKKEIPISLDELGHIASNIIFNGIKESVVD